MQPHAHINGRYRSGADYEVPAVDFAASAMELAKIGFHVFPLKVNEKVPALSKAEGGQGFKDATIQPALIREQGQRFPHANVGIRTGAESGVIIIDVDPRNGGNETLKAMLAEAGCALPENTPTALTGNGGRHYFFAYEPGIGCSNNRLGPGIDVKSDGGYVVVSPSIIGPSKNGPGGPYKWTCVAVRCSAGAIARVATRAAPAL